jgi:hypothetical protein
MARRFRRLRDPDPRRGQTEQTETILREKKKAPVKRLDPDQQAATVQVIDGLDGNLTGLGELSFTGSAIESASFDATEGRVTLNVVPKFDVDVIFGSEEESFS